MFDSEDTKDQHPPATGQISGQIFRICQEKKITLGHTPCRKRLHSDCMVINGDYG